MRLRQLSRVVTRINPDTVATLQKANGYTVGANFKQVPAFTTSSGVLQVQELAAEERKQLEGVNQGDVLRKVFLDGSWDSVARQTLSGGDRFIFGGFVWGVVRVLEQWPDWTAVAVAQLAPWVDPPAAP